MSSTTHRAVSQLYFPDELTDQVFARLPYAGRSPRDTTNAIDSIFADGGSRTVLQLTGDALGGLTVTEWCLRSPLKDLRCDAASLETCDRIESRSRKQWSRATRPSPPQS